MDVVADQRMLLSSPHALGSVRLAIREPNMNTACDRIAAIAQVACDFTFHSICE